MEEERYLKRQRIYKTIMLIIVVALITFMITSAFLYKKLGSSSYILGNIKKEYNIQNSVISSAYYINLIKKVQKEEDTSSIEELARKYKTTKESVIIALNFSNKMTYLNDEELDQIMDSNQNRLEIDLCNLDQEEKMIYHLRVNKK